MPSVGEYLKPYWMTTDRRTVRLYLGNVVDVLGRMGRGSVHCVVTSPPYYRLRDYGTGTWVGGKDGCDHLRPPLGGVRATTLARPLQYDENGYTTGKTNPNRVQYSGECGKCGARRLDLQIGGESEPDCGSKGQAECGCYVCRMVGVFRGVWRVLHDSGTVWLNLGDSYGEGSQLLGIPWRVALALQADGWVLRQDVIWHKPSPMPESVRNRCTKSHEYVFLLAKRPGYFCDMEAVKERSVDAESLNGMRRRGKDKLSRSGSIGSNYRAGFSKRDGETYPEKNKRSVWTVEDHTALVCYLSEHYPDVLNDFLGGSKSKSSLWKVPPAGYPGAHFAVYPPKLIEPCIRAGTSQYGFVGSGTTCEVALENGRYSAGIDLSETYLKQNAIQRLEGVLYRRRSTAGLVPMEPRKPFRLRKS
jgi:DNA modification methylase